MKIIPGGNLKGQARVDEMIEVLGERDGVNYRKRLDELANGAKPRAGKHAHLPAQFSSTLENMERQAKGIDRDWDAPIENWKADADAEKVFREVNKASLQDISHARSVHHSPKNEAGESKLSATTPERRESAVHHFEVCGSVEAEDLSLQDRERITGLAPIKSEPPPPLELKRKKKTIGGMGRSVMEMLWGKK